MNFKELLRKFEADPESVNLDLLMSIGAREKIAILAPYFRNKREFYHGELQYNLIFRNNFNYLGIKDLVFGEVSAGNIETHYFDPTINDYIETPDPSKKPPYFFRLIEPNVNYVNIVYFDIISERNDPGMFYYNIEHGSLPNQTLDFFKMKEYGPYKTKEDFFSNIEKRMVSFGEMIPFEDFYDFEPYFYDYLFIPYLFGQDNFEGE